MPSGPDPADASPGTAPPGLPDALRDIDGAEVGESMFVDGPALWIDGKEILHADKADCFDVRLTRQVIRELRDRLRADRRVTLRPSSSSDWIEVRIFSPEDDALLGELVGRAVGAHRPPNGRPAASPPSGAALARRRRFH